MTSGGAGAADANQYRLVLVTCPNDRADEIANILVGASLCACVNIVPNMRSVYRWQGAITSDEESLLVMKTMAKIYDKLEAKIKEIHPYDEPEILSLEIEKGSRSYLDWVSSVVAGD